MYDALNVLMAMNIISKEKKEIKWIGLPTNSAQECQNLEVGAATVSSFPPTCRCARCRLQFVIAVWCAGGEAEAAGED